MQASATGIAGQLLTIDDCRFLVAIDQKNKDLQRVILALPEVSRKSTTMRLACPDRYVGRSDLRAGLFSTANARLSIRRVVASRMNCRMNVRPPDRNSG
jgi:hypothetical protein